MRNRVYSIITFAFADLINKKIASDAKSNDSCKNNAEYNKIAIHVIKITP